MHLKVVGTVLQDIPSGIRLIAIYALIVHKLIGVIGIAMITSSAFYLYQLHIVSLNKNPQMRVSHLREGFMWKGVN